MNPDTRENTVSSVPDNGSSQERDDESPEVLLELEKSTVEDSNRKIKPLSVTFSAPHREVSASFRNRRRSGEEFDGDEDDNDITGNYDREEIGYGGVDGKNVKNTQMCDMWTSCRHILKILISSCTEI